MDNPSGFRASLPDDLWVLSLFYLRNCFQLWLASDPGKLDAGVLLDRGNMVLSSSNFSHGQHSGGGYG
jgi:hypothetical protein